jgi:toxin secretion/phage lysis holin
MKDVTNGMIGVTTSGLAYLIGGVDQLAISLGIFMVIDYVTGVMSAGKAGSVTSNRAYTGLKKKAGMIAFVVICNQLDLISGNDAGFLRNAMIMALIGTEGISIAENCGRLGLNVPPFLKNALEQLKDKK